MKTTQNPYTARTYENTNWAMLAQQKTRTNNGIFYGMVVIESEVWPMGVQLTMNPGYVYNNAPRLFGYVYVISIYFHNFSSFD